MANGLGDVDRAHGAHTAVIEVAKSAEQRPAGHMPYALCEAPAATRATHPVGRIDHSASLVLIFKSSILRHLELPW